MKSQLLCVIQKLDNKFIHFNLCIKQQLLLVIRNALVILARLLIEYLKLLMVINGNLQMIIPN